MPETEAKKKRAGVWASMSPGLKAALEQAVIREGISASIILRKGIMGYLSVDANGVPVDRGDHYGV